MIKNKIAIVLSLILLLILVWVALFWTPSEQASDQHKLLSLSHQPVGGDFVVDVRGGTLSLESLRGQLVILYFGYTLCSDICPTSLSLLSSALNQLTPDELSQVQPVFISLDPERDNLSRLAHYADYFHPKLIAATSTEEQISAIAKLYGVSYQKRDSDSSLGYLVDHSSNLYLIDRQGTLQSTLAHGTEPANIAHSIKELLVSQQ